MNADDRKRKKYSFKCGCGGGLGVQISKDSVVSSQDSGLTLPRIKVPLTLAAVMGSGWVASARRACGAAGRLCAGRPRAGGASCARWSP